MRKIAGLLAFAAAIAILPKGGMAQQPIHWEPTLNVAQRMAAQSNRLVLASFWAPWCGICRNMEAKVLNQPSVASVIAAEYVAVKINADHFPATAKQYGITGLPTTLILTPQGQVLETMRGWVGAEDLTGRLSRVALQTKQSKPQQGPVYAQLPGGTPATGVAPQTSPSAQPPMSAPSQPATAAAQPAGVEGPALGLNSQPSVVGNQPANNRQGLTDDRYADFFRNQAAPAGQTLQPSLPSAAPVHAQPPIAANAAPVQMTPPPIQTAASPTNPPLMASAAPPNAGMALQPPSQTPAGPLMTQPAPMQASAPMNAAMPYGSPSPMLQTQTSPPPSNPSVPAFAANAGPTIPTLNPPLGLDGYCPVALAEKPAWVAGDRRWGGIHRGRTYLFSGPEEQRRFFADPDRYAPVISGNDIVLATERGQAVPGLREHGVSYNNRVYLFASEATLEKFNRNPDQYVNQAIGAVQPGSYAGPAVR